MKNLLTQIHNARKITKKVILTSLLFVSQLANFQTAKAQVCCLTTNLNISTGYNPSTTILATTPTDPKWKCSSINPDFLNAITATGGLTPVAAGAAAYIIPAVGSFAISPSSQWINCFNGPYFSSGLVAGLPQFIMTRDFKTCGNSCITFDLNIAVDNWISDISVSNGLTWIPLPYSQFAGTYSHPFDHIVRGCINLNAGWHTIRVTCHEDNDMTWVNTTNASGLNIFGAISSVPANAIVNESAFCDPAAYTCLDPISGINHVCVGLQTWLSVSPRRCMDKQSTWRRFCCINYRGCNRGISWCYNNYLYTWWMFRYIPCNSICNPRCNYRNFSNLSRDNSYLE